MKKTPWFPVAVKPVRIGWYECRCCPLKDGEYKRHYWDGIWWRWGKGQKLIYTDAWIDWRGIAK